MNKAQYVGTVPLNFLDRSESNWRSRAMEDIIHECFITSPPNYLFTLGSGVSSTMTSLATTPSYYLPTSSQFYLAGRDVFRWGGSSDPHEIDIDHYGFTPDYSRGAAIVFKAPKSELHHLSKMPQMMDYLPPEWKEICVTILNNQLP